MLKLKSLLLFAFPVIIMASDLSEIVQKVQNNEMIQSMNYAVLAQSKASEAIVAAAFPKVTANYMYQYIGEDQRGLFDPEHSGSIEASAVLFSGFRLTEGTKAQDNRVYATKESLEFQKEKFSLSAINLYFNMKTVQANIDARIQKEKQFENELTRLERFFEAGSITEDKVEQVRAALAMTKYELEFLKQNYQELAFSLETLTGKQITSVGDATLLERSVESKEESHEINSIEYEIKALGHDAKVKTAGYWPSVIIKDTYTKNEFYETDLPPSMSVPTSTNKIQVLASITLFDFAAKSKDRQIVEMQRQAKKSELAFKRRDADLQKRFASLKLKTVKAKIASSKISEDASKKSFEFIQKQHEANLVDTSIYLDSATQYFNAKSILESAKYEYQMALANYYFYNNTPLAEMIK